jgi:hypothetical protein
VREDLKPIRLFCIATTLAATLGTGCVQAQEPASALEQPPQGTVRWSPANVSLLSYNLFSEDPQQANPPADGQSSTQGAPAPQAGPAGSNSPASNPNDQQGKQPKRILGIIPNYRAVSANSHLPLLSFKEKFWLATQDTFDYSDFIFVGGLAGISMADKSEPTFGQGGAGYGRYYWHLFVDGGIEN